MILFSCGWPFYLVLLACLHKFENVFGFIPTRSRTVSGQVRWQRELRRLTPVAKEQLRIKGLVSPLVTTQKQNLLQPSVSNLVPLKINGTIARLQRKSSSVPLVSRVSKHIDTPQASSDETLGLCSECSKKVTSIPSLSSPSSKQQMIDKLTELIMSLPSEDRKELLARVSDPSDHDDGAQQTQVGGGSSTNSDGLSSTMVTTFKPSSSLGIDGMESIDNANKEQQQGKEHEKISNYRPTGSAKKTTQFLEMNAKNKEHYSKILKTMQRAGEQLVENERRLVHAQRLLRVSTLFLNECKAISEKKHGSLNSLLRSLPLPDDSRVYGGEEMQEIDNMRSMTQHELYLERCKYLESKRRFEKVRMQCRGKQYAASLQLARLKALEKRQQQLSNEQQEQH